MDLSELLHDDRPFALLRRRAPATTTTSWNSWSAP